MKCILKKRFFTCYLAFILLSITGMTFNAYAAASSVQEQLAKLEADTGVRLGIYAINTANNQSIRFRAEEHFPVQSTFKLMGVAAVLHQSMLNKDLLSQKISYTKKDLVFWSPITEKNLGKDMTVLELCAAAMKYSDGAAINLLVKKLGGLNRITSFARLIGDHTFRLDHYEPDMNSNPNDLHDTDTPEAMAKNLEKLTRTPVLDSAQREQLINWMRHNTTGDKRIRAGVPKTWIVADKTGSGSYGVVNDLGIIWPPNRPPIIVAIYTVQNKKDAVPRDDVVASATHILIQEFGKQEAKNPKTDVLQRVDLSGTNYQVGMGIAEFAPYAVKESQTQTGPEVLYVLAGKITYFAKGKTARTIKAGESYQIPAGEIHFSKAGSTGARVLATWVLEKGKPFAIPSSS